MLYETSVPILTFGQLMCLQLLLGLDTYCTFYFYSLNKIMTSSTREGQNGVSHSFRSQCNASKNTSLMHISRVQMGIVTWESEAHSGACGG